MLPLDYKFHVVNNLGVDMDLSTNSANEIFELTLRKWKITSSGVLDYQTETVLTYSAADVATGTSFELTGQDNSTDLRFGVHGVIKFQTDDATADGTVDLYVEHSTDGGTEFPSDAADFDPEVDLDHVCSLRIVGDGAGYVRARNFSYEG